MVSRLWRIAALLGDGTPRPTWCFSRDVMALIGQQSSFRGAVVELHVRYAGVSVGTTTLGALTGLAHGVLTPSSGYELVRAQVEDAGRQLAPNGLVARRYWPPTSEDFAELVASTVAGGYELEDLRGMRVSAASVAVFAALGREAQPLVVVDFRPHAAHEFAALPEIDDAGGGRRRPAA